MLRLQVVERAILQSQLALMDEQNTALRLRMEQVCMGRMGPHMAQLPTVHGCEGRKGSVWKEQGKANKHKQQKKTDCCMDMQTSAFICRQLLKNVLELSNRSVNFKP